MGESLFSRSYFDAVYIPAGLIVFGTWIMKKEFVPYAAAIAVALAGFKFYGLRKFPPRLVPHGAGSFANTSRCLRAQEGSHPRHVPGV